MVMTIASKSSCSGISEGIPTPKSSHVEQIVEADSKASRLTLFRESKTKAIS
jgi:hypothetical protein